MLSSLENNLPIAYIPVGASCKFKMSATTTKGVLDASHVQDLKPKQKSRLQVRAQKVRSWILNHNFKMSVEKEALCDVWVCKDQKLPFFVLQEQKLKPTHWIGRSWEWDMLLWPVLLYILTITAHNSRFHPKNRDIVNFSYFLYCLSFYLHYNLTFFVGLIEEMGKDRKDKKFYTQGPLPMISWIICHNMVSVHVNDIW